MEKSLLLFRAVILAAVTLLAGEPAHAAPPPDVKFHNLDVADGLSNNQVNVVYRDSRGYMWFGTASGLNRFDGFGIANFRKNIADSLSLNDNYVQDIQEDAQGRLWIKAGDEYSIYDTPSERFHSLDIDDYSALGIDFEPVMICVDGDELWLGGRNEALYRRRDGSTTKVADLPPGHNSITCFREIPGAGMMVGVTDYMTLILVDKASNHATLIAPPAGNIPASEYQIFPGSDNKLWVFSENGVMRYDLSTRGWDAAPAEIGSEMVRAIERDADGNLWIGTDKNGIYVFGANGEKHHILNNPLDPYSLNNNSIREIYSDGEGGVWIGTYKKGVSIHFSSEYKFDTYRGPDINCIARDLRNPQQRAWAGTDSRGLMTFDFATKDFQPIRLPAEWDSYAITCLAPDQKGGVWFGTFKGGLGYYRDGSTRRFTTADGLASNEIWALEVDSDNSLWIGTLGRGLQHYSPESDTFKTFQSKVTPLRSNYINTLNLAPNGLLYIGTTNGASVYNPKTQQIESESLERLNSALSANHNINQLLCDSRDLLWVATREGLKVYDAKTDTVYAVEPYPHKLNPFVLGMCEGPDRSMWIAIDRDLVNLRVNYLRDEDRYEFTPTIFNELDGVNPGTFNQRSMCVIPSGEILTGCLNGIVAIDPSRLAFNSRAANVMFTGFGLRSEKVEIGREYDGNLVLPQAVNMTDQITLLPTQNDFIISFSTDKYARCDQPDFEYRLAGFDKDWIRSPKEESHASYTNIPPGEYTFMVRAIDPYGEPLSAKRELKIEVRTPWYCTWWAILIYVVIALAIVTGVILFVRQRALEKLLARQRDERARKDEELNQLKFRFFTNISHELRTPLTLILSPVDSMLKECDDPRDMRRLTTIHNNASRLLNLVNQLLDFRKIEMTGLRLHLSKGDMVGVIRSVCSSFVGLSERRNIDIQFIHPALDELEMAFDNDKMTKTITNLLSNAVKYTPEGGHITVGLQREGGNVVISVADTGKGISDEDKKHIFERFYRGNDRSDLNTGTGIGLSLVYDYVELHGGKVEVADNEPQGCVFKVTIPYRDDAEVKAPKPDGEAGAVQPQPDGEKQPQPEGHAAEKSRRHSVLFVDDNKDLTDFLKDEFSELYDVVTASDGIEALRKVKEQKFDLIVSDIMMPNMDGIELCRKLKSSAETVNIPLIMLTAKQDVTSMVEGLTLGADDYITKPFNNDVLSLKIRHLINLRSSGSKRTLIEPTPSDIEITPLDEQLVNKAVKYVEDNMSRPELSVEELSREMGMSRVQLYKKLLALTGKTPIEFIRLLRLKRAAQYLRESQLTIAEIAYKSGFNNPKYFTKYFKEEFGLTPSDYQAHRD